MQIDTERCALESAIDENESRDFQIDLMRKAKSEESEESDVELEPKIHVSSLSSHCSLKLAHG